MQQKFSYCLLFLMFCSLSIAQISITGTITNQDDLPLADSHIHIGSKTVSSDLNGNYSIKTSSKGKIKIHVSYIGYQPIDTVLMIIATTELDFKMKKSTSNLKEIIILKDRNTINKTVLEQKIKSETIEKYSTKSLGDVLREVTGVSSLKTGSTVVKPIINGLYGSRVTVIANNVRLEDQDWGVEHAPTFDVNAAGKITVIKGASGLQYGGDAIGGVVIIEPLAVKKDSLYGKSIVSFDSNGKGGVVATSIHKSKNRGFGYNALVTNKYFGDRQAAKYVLSNTGNREKNFTGDLQFSATKFDVTAFYSLYTAKLGILKAAHTGNVTDLENSINNKVPAIINNFTYDIDSPRQEVMHHLAKVSLNYFFNETASLAANYSFQFNNRKEFDVRRGDFKNQAALDLELKTHALTLDFKKITHDWTLKSGFSSSIQNNFANPETGIRPLIPNYNKTAYGIYGVVSQAFANDFILETGVRYDYTAIEATKFYSKSRWTERGYAAQFSPFIVGDFGSQWLTKPTFTFHNSSASIGLHKKSDNNVDWFLNVALAARNPNPSEFFSDGLHHSTGVIELGDLKLKKEKLVKVSGTMQKKWKELTLELNPYINLIKDYIFLRPVGFETTIRGAFPTFNYQQTNARLVGIDLQSTIRIETNWQHMFSISYINGHDVSQNAALIDMPPLTIKNKIQFSKKEWNSLLIALDGEVQMQQNRFPNNNFNTIIFVNNESKEVEVDISTPPKSFGILNFYSEMKFKIFPKVHSVFAFSVQNILNTSYRDYLNRQRYFANEVGRNLQIQLKINY